MIYNALADDDNAWANANAKTQVAIRTMVIHHLRKSAAGSSVFAIEAFAIFHANQPKKPSNPAPIRMFMNISMQ